MLFVFGICFLLFNVCVGLDRKKCDTSLHGLDCVPPDEIDLAIVDIGMYYSDKLCEAILMINCSKHVTLFDEIVCGNDNVTYSDHCQFANARCFTILLSPANPLVLARHGPCPGYIPTTRKPKPTSSTLATMITKPFTITTDKPPVTTPGKFNVTTPDKLPPTTTTKTTTTTDYFPPTSMGLAVTTTTDMMTTTMEPTTTEEPPTTTDPLHSIIHNVFCSNIAYVSCNTGFDIVCGSDGKFYPNDCALSKAKCTAPSLVKVNIDKCNIPEVQS